MPIPIRQLLSQTSYDTDGTTTVWNFSFSGGYLDKAHVKAEVRNTGTGDLDQIPVTLGMFLGPFQLSITPALMPGNVLTIYRNSLEDGTPIVDFSDTAALTETALDVNAQQAIFSAAECTDRINTSLADANVQLAIDASDAAAASAASALVAANAAAASAATAVAAMATKADLAITVTKDTDTGAANIPTGNTAQRPANGAGKFRFNTTLGRAEMNNGTVWGSLGGATGGGPDAAFYENDQIITTSYTLSAGRNAMTAGPITINVGAVVTVPTGATWSVV